MRQAYQKIVKVIKKLSNSIIRSMIKDLFINLFTVFTLTLYLHSLYLH